VVSQAITFAEEKRVDILVNNAGVMQVSGKRKLTINGFEENLGINFLGESRWPQRSWLMG